MTTLKVTPALQADVSNTPYYPHLLTDTSKTVDIERPTPTNDRPKPAPMQPSVLNGSYAHIEAQMLAGSTQRTFRRPTASSPRDAARAYGQARRRPQTVTDQPRLQNVV